MNREPTASFASVLTGRGRGAIAVVRAWGTDVLATIDPAFRPAAGRRLKETPAGSPRFGKFGPSPGEEVVAIPRDGDPPGVEIHCHGGEAAVRRTCEVLMALGVAIVEAKDEADHALAGATTLKTAQILQDQVDGAWDREWAEIREMAGRTPASAASRVDELLARAEVGLRLLSGWRVVLTGRPNVGKSRLMNALAGYDRSVVSPSAGTTRDVVTCRIAVDGWPVEIADTAGLRHGAGDLESSGIALARDRIATSDLTVIVLDRSSPLDQEDLALIEAQPDGLVVANKADLASAWGEGPATAMTVSAATGGGLPDLLVEIARRIVPRPPPAGSAVPFLADQVENLRQMRIRLTSQ